MAEMWASFVADVVAVALTAFVLAAVLVGSWVLAFVAGAAGAGQVSGDEYRCVPVMDDDGTVLGHARVSPDLGDEGRAALLSLAKAASRLQAERDAADPEAAAERARRQEAARARVAGRMRRFRGEAG